MYKFTGFYHRKGKSQKSGNEYDFFQCSFLSQYPSRSDCEGWEALNINVNPDDFYAFDMAGNLGKDCDIFFSRYGRIEQVRFTK